MSTINDRIKIIVNQIFNKNISEFERASGIKPSTVKNIIGGRLTRPSYDILESIIRNNVLLSAEWLLRGEGNMLRTVIPNDSSISSDKNAKHVDYNNCDMNGRILEFIKEKDLSISSLAKIIGMNQSNLSMQFSGSRKLSLETVVSLLNSFNDISAEWLLRGEGEMLKQSNISQDEDSSQKNTDQNAEYWKHIALSNMEIMTLHVDDLNARIKELEAEILNLKSNGSMELSSSANPA